MTKNTPDGGLAFPNTEVWHPTTGDPIWQGQAGMTLRDYFAAHAPAPTEQWINDSLGDGEHVLKAESAWRYAYADAMLAERAKIDPLLRSLGETA